MRVGGCFFEASPWSTSSSIEEYFGLFFAGGIFKFFILFVPLRQRTPFREVSSNILCEATPCTGVPV